VLRDVSFDVAVGETLGVIGGNGSGKSTLLRLLAGLSRPTLGTIATQGSIGAILTLGEGFQPLLSGEENAVTGAVLGGLTGRQAKARLAEVAAFSGLEDHLDQPIRTYSDGMRLRLAFAVAITIRPDILLVDEVLAVGDMAFQQRCLARMDELQADGVTVVVASHDLVQLDRMATRVLWLDQGSMRFLGATTEAVERYEQHAHAHVGELPPGREGEARHGSGEVEIVDVRLRNALGEATTVVVPGRPVTIEVDLVAHEAVRDAICVVSAHAVDDGAVCFDLNSETDGFSLGRLDGGRTIQLHLERLDLAGGAYALDVGVFDVSWDRPFDYRWAVLPVTVTGPVHPGPLGPPRKWSVG
jgi:lipopolysaccharide transport system ATP-binding protein